jgi:hypothetical protein
VNLFKKLPKSCGPTTSNQLEIHSFFSLSLLLRGARTSPRRGEFAVPSSWYGELPPPLPCVVVPNQPLHKWCPLSETDKIPLYLEQDEGQNDALWLRKRGRNFQRKVHSLLK